MPLTMDFTETLVVTHCWCGIAVGIPETLHAWAKQSNKNSIHCPLGHSFIFGDSFEQKLEREREQHQATRDLLTSEERSHTATRGHLTRARKRAAAGVCPCCKRSFENLARHVRTKHPDFKAEELPA